MAETEAATRWSISLQGCQLHWCVGKCANGAGLASSPSKRHVKEPVAPCGQAKYQRPVAHQTLGAATGIPNVFSSFHLPCFPGHKDKLWHHQPAHAAKVFMCPPETNGFPEIQQDRFFDSSK